MEYYIGHLRINLISDAFLVELSFEDNPPRQNKLRDLPQWTLSSRNAIWLLSENETPLKRAEDGEKIKTALSTFLQ